MCRHRRTGVPALLSAPESTASGVRLPRPCSRRTAPRGRCGSPPASARRPPTWVSLHWHGDARGHAISRRARRWSRICAPCLRRSALPSDCCRRSSDSCSCRASRCRDIPSSRSWRKEKSRRICCPPYYIGKEWCPPHADSRCSVCAPRSWSCPHTGKGCRSSTCFPRVPHRCPPYIPAGKARRAPLPWPPRSASDCHTPKLSPPGVSWPCRPASHTLAESWDSVP